MSKQSPRLRLEKVLLRYRLEDIPTYVIPVIPELSWNEVKNTIAKQERRFIKKDIISIITNWCFDDSKLNYDNLNESIARLELISVAKYNRYTWSVYELKSDMEPTTVQRRLLREKFEIAFKKNGVSATVDIFSSEEMHWIRVEPITKLKKPARPIFFAYSLFDNYFFTNIKSIKNAIMLSICKGLGFASCKLQSLTGKSIPSLIQLLRNRENKATCVDDIIIGRKYKVLSPFVLIERVYDFRHDNDRMKYSQQCFGKKPPLLEKLNLQTMGSTWNATSIYTGHQGMSFDTRLEVASNNIFRTIHNMCVNQAVNSPMPVYMSQLVKFGKNRCRLKSTTV